MFLNIILESFENLYDALEKRKNLLSKFSEILASNENISEELKDFVFVLIQTSLFSDDGITKIIFYMDMDVDSQTEKSILEGIKEGIELN